MPMSVRLVGSMAGTLSSTPQTSNFAVGGSGAAVGDVLIASHVANIGGSFAWSDNQGNTWETKGGFAYCKVTNALSSTDTVSFTYSQSGGGTPRVMAAVALVASPSWSGEPNLALIQTVSDTEDYVAIPSPPGGEWVVFFWQSEKHGTQTGDQIDIAPMPAGWTQLSSLELTGAWDLAYRFGYQIVSAAGNVSFIATDAAMADPDFDNDITGLTGFGPAAAAEGIIAGIQVG